MQAWRMFLGRLPLSGAAAQVTGFARLKKRGQILHGRSEQFHTENLTGDEVALPGAVDAQ
jgi:hypothetical protein